LEPCSTTKTSIGERLGDNIQWKNFRPTLHHQTANTIEKWRESYGNWLVNFALQARAKSYLTLRCVMNEEQTIWTREAPLA
jgi:hypothetical protein